MIGFLATVVNCVLMLAILTLLAGLRSRLKGAPFAAPWHDGRRLWRKNQVVPAGSSLVWAAAPAASLAAATAAAILLPAVAIGGLLAPAADALLVGGLLGASRGILVLATFDAGAAPATHAAVAVLRARTGTVPVFLLAALAALLLGGSTNLEAAAVAVRDGSGTARAAGLLAGLAVLACLPGPATSAFHWTGRRRALVLLAAELRGMTGLLLAAALLCPYGTATVPEAWLLGAAVAVVKLLLLGALVAAAPSSPLLLPVGAVLGVAAILLAGLGATA